MRALSTLTAALAGGAVTALALTGGTATAGTPDSEAPSAVRSSTGQVGALAPSQQPFGQNSRSVRVSGENRYETAVALSQDSWTDVAPPADSDDTRLEAFLVYLTSGVSTFDSVVLGSSDFDAGPNLITMRDTLPEVVRAEIERLKPCYIYVVGGTGVVSDAVANQADALADDTQAKCQAP